MTTKLTQAKSSGLLGGQILRSVSVVPESGAGQSPAPRETVQHSKSDIMMRYIEFDGQC